MRVFESLDEFKAAKGEVLGPSDWVTITQEQINGFADATGDHPWIHTDPERAKDGPFGTTIAHGYLTLSLLPAFTESLYEVKGLTMGLNYGANKLRFLTPVPVNSRVRATATVQDVAEIAIGSAITLAFTVELENAEKPALIAEVVYVMAA